MNTKIFNWFRGVVKDSYTLAIVAAMAAALLLAIAGPR